MYKIRVVYGNNSSLYNNLIFVHSVYCVVAATNIIKPYSSRWCRKNNKSLTSDLGQLHPMQSDQQLYIPKESNKFKSSKGPVLIFSLPKLCSMYVERRVHIVSTPWWWFIPSKIMRIYLVAAVFYLGKSIKFLF